MVTGEIGTCKGNDMSEIYVACTLNVPAVDSIICCCGFINPLHFFVLSALPRTKQVTGFATL